MNPAEDIRIKTKEEETPSLATNENKANRSENPSMGSLTSLASSIQLHNNQLPSTPPNPSSHSFHGSAEELISSQAPKLESPECNNRVQKSSPELSGSSSRSPSQSQDDGGCQEEKKAGELVLGDAQSSPLSLPEVSSGCFQPFRGSYSEQS